MKWFERPPYTAKPVIAQEDVPTYRYWWEPIYKNPPKENKVGFRSAFNLCHDDKCWRLIDIHVPVFAVRQVWIGDGTGPKYVYDRIEHDDLWHPSLVVDKMDPKDIGL